jgi:hypothetical protein
MYSHTTTYISLPHNSHFVSWKQRPFIQIFNNSYTAGHLNVKKPPSCTLLMEGFPTISSLVVAITYPNDELHSKISRVTPWPEKRLWNHPMLYSVNLKIL